MQRFLLTFSTIVVIVVLFLLCQSCANSNSSDYDTIECITNFEKEHEELPWREKYGDVDVQLNFEIYKHSYTIELSLEDEIIKSYSSKPKQLGPYEGEAQDFYNLMLTDEDDIQILTGILQTLRDRTIGTQYDIVQMIIAFVQTIPYDSYAADVNYPYETLAFNKGDCDEKSILLCKLLNMEGYDAVLFALHNEGHMGVGLRVADDGYYNNGYVFIESTATFPINIRGSKATNEIPEVIYPYDNGEGYYEQFLDIENCYEEITLKYGEYYLKTDITGKELLEEMVKVEEELEKLQLTLDSLTQNVDLLYEKVLVKDEIITSLTSEFELLNCTAAKNETIYKKCLILQDSIESILGERDDIYEDYTSQFNNSNEVIELYNSSVRKYNQIVEKYNNNNEASSSPYTRTEVASK